MKLNTILRNKGYRITSQRKEILHSLYTYPSTVEEIFGALKKNKAKIDLASIYRTLTLFVKLGLVREIELGDGKKRYELIDEKRHHHHLVCNNCGNIEDIYLEKESTLVKEAKEKSNYQINYHSLEFFGVCVNCQ